MIKLNLGCGSIRPDGWINTDSSWNANIQRVPLLGDLTRYLFKTVVYSSSNVTYMNLNKRWPYKDNSVDIIYASHLYEHLSVNSAQLFLTEAYRCLKPDGKIRIVVPDLYKICKKYIANYESGNEPSTEFIMWAINMHREGQYGYKIPIWKKIILEIQGYPHQHKFMYDEKSLSTKISNAGFLKINSKTYGESEYIDCINDVEGSKESYLSIYIEAKK